MSSVAAHADFEMVRVVLAAFRSEWPPGLERDGVLVGLNRSGSRATGYGAYPASVEAALRIRAVNNCRAASPP